MKIKELIIVAVSIFLSGGIVGLMYIQKYGVLSGRPYFTSEWDAFLLWGVSSLCLFSLILYSNYKRESISYICPSCENIVDGKDGESPVCFKCGELMEKLEGFYERREKEKGDTDE